MFSQVGEKCYVQSEATEVCEFRAKISAFYCSLQRRFAHIQREKFTQRVFLAKKVKNISEMEWNSFVCFTVDKENCVEPAKQQREGKNRTKRKHMFCFLSELPCLQFITLSLN